MHGSWAWFITVLIQLNFRDFIYSAATTWTMNPVCDALKSKRVGWTFKVARDLGLSCLSSLFDAPPWDQLPPGCEGSALPKQTASSFLMLSSQNTRAFSSLVNSENSSNVRNCPAQGFLASSIVSQYYQLLCSLQCATCLHSQKNAPVSVFPNS